MAEQHKLFHILKRFQSLPVWLVCLFLFLFLFTYRVVLAFEFKRDLTSDHCEVENVAVTLARDGVFGTPYKVPTGPTSHVAPAYAGLLGLIYKTLGTGAPGEAARQLLCCGVTSLQYGLLPLLSVVAGLGLWTGVIAGLAGGLLITHFWIETKCTFGEPYHSLILILLCASTLKLWKRSEISTGQSVALGLGWGVAFLFAPNLLTVFCGLICLEFVLFARGQRRRRLLHFGLVAATIAAVLAPWTIRNYRQFHRWIFVRGNFGLELAVANTESSALTVMENVKRPSKIHPNQNDVAARELRDIGETAYFARMTRLAMTWISEHPAEFAHRTAVRCLYFWFPPPLEGNRPLFRAAIVWAITLLGFAGLILMRKRGPIFWFICVLWLTFPAVYYIVLFDPRYRYPIDWSILFCAAYALARRIPALRAAPRAPAR
ncbi:MAG: hypothetical protein ACM3S5_03955 [Rhodospirillales bacterium]